MKYRRGFVSNSSTSSFVLVGFELSDEVGEEGSERMKKLLIDLYDVEPSTLEGIEDYELADDFYHKSRNGENGVTILSGSDNGVGDSTVIGVMLAETNSCDTFYLPDKVISIREIEEKLKEIKEIIGEDSEIKIYCGSKMG